MTDARAFRAFLAAFAGNLVAVTASTFAMLDVSRAIDVDRAAMTADLDGIGDVHREIIDPMVDVGAGFLGIGDDLVGVTHDPDGSGRATAGFVADPTKVTTSPRPV